MQSSLCDIHPSRHHWTKSRAPFSSVYQAEAFRTNLTHLLTSRVCKSRSRGLSTWIRLTFCRSAVSSSLSFLCLIFPPRVIHQNSTDIVCLLLEPFLSRYYTNFIVHHIEVSEYDIRSRRKPMGGYFIRTRRPHKFQNDTLSAHRLVRAAHTTPSFLFTINTPGALL